MNEEKELSTETKVCVLWKTKELNDELMEVIIRKHESYDILIKELRDKVAEMNKAVTELRAKAKELEQHREVSIECTNALCDRIDRLDSEVFGEDPYTEEEDTTPDDGGDDKYEQWKEEQDEA